MKSVTVTNQIVTQIVNFFKNKTVTETEIVKKKLDKSKDSLLGIFFIPFYNKFTCRADSKYVPDYW